MTAEVRRWVDGSAYDFLGLSLEESAYVDLKLRLSKALRRYRMRRPLSQSALAKLIKSSQSRVAKMENGDPSVSIDLLLRALILLGVTRSELARVLVFEEPKSLWSFSAGDVVTAHANSSQGGIGWPMVLYRDDKRVTAEVKVVPSAFVILSGSTAENAPLISALSH